MALTDGAFNERLLPLLLEALPRAGGDIAPLQTAMDAIVRDKSQALDQLDKVRATGMAWLCCICALVIQSQPAQTPLYRIAHAS